MAWLDRGTMAEKGVASTSTRLLYLLVRKAQTIQNLNDTAFSFFLSKLHLLTTVAHGQFLPYPLIGVTVWTALKNKDTQYSCNSNR